ncbi:Coenzyme A biosynthesis bifunctional protein CoaBC [Anoxybacillus sp. BCO1]|nr:Coenzyme A biosynthesis bifunctional protein CoaBC [Anoxybacillus sp. BCO1]
MVTTILLATKAPVWLAPAMNVHMYEHPAVQQNMRTLQSYGYRFIEPAEGMLACGYVGKGRLEEPETIVALLEQHVASNELLKGKKVLVTAGPTREKLDPVRFFSNHSTGKMGYAIAEAARDLGADVILISGPTSLARPEGVQTIRVESAQDMYEAVMEHFQHSDIVIKTAAVADYRPKYVADNKIKKQQGDYTVVLERTIDILQTLGEQKTHQFLVGFAAETNDVERYAKEKLARKNADMIVANNVVQEGAGFGTDTNIVTIFKRDGTAKQLPLLPKSEVAKQILYEIYHEIEGRL